MNKARFRCSSQRSVAVTAATGAFLLSMVGFSVVTAPASACSCGAPGYLRITSNLATVNKPVPVNVLPTVKLWSMREDSIEASTVVRLESSNGSQITGSWTRINDGWDRFRPDGMLAPGNYRLVYSYCNQVAPADCPMKPAWEVLDEFQVGTEFDDTPPGFSRVSLSCEFITCRNSDSCCDESTQHWNVGFSDEIRTDGEYVRATVTALEWGTKTTEVIGNVLAVGPWISCPVEHGFNWTVPTTPIRMALSVVDLAGNETSFDGEVTIDLSGGCKISAPTSIRVSPRGDAGVDIMDSAADGGVAMIDGWEKNPNVDQSSNGCSFLAKRQSSPASVWPSFLMAAIFGRRLRRRSKK